MTWDISASLATDAGCVRDSNEDTGRIIQPGDAAAREQRGVLAIVADGMGGHSAGEVASRLAVETIHRDYYDGVGGPGADLAAALGAANRAIFNHSRTSAALNGMGTTCVALVCCGDDAYGAHVGDSRIYLVRGGGIYQMTNDDSAVGGMVRQGLLTREEARHHEERNVLLKALGTHDNIGVSRWDAPFPLKDRDVFVLCSDGLTDLVEDHEILAAVRDAHVNDASQSLVDLAKARGGFDNITVAVMRVTAAHDADSRQAGHYTAPETREVKVTA